jgi:lysophospholipase L1-like esterase
VVIIACLGDSITAGSPLWDPDPEVRKKIEHPDERSQWEWWAMRMHGELDLRNFGVHGERTDQIAARFGHAVDGAEAIVVQGGINDIVQGRPVEQAAANLAGMVHRARNAGLRVGIADVLPWNNGDAEAAARIRRLNALIQAAACGLAAPLLPFHDTLADPDDASRMAPGLSDDGDHPSPAGHRLLGERAFRLPVRARAAGGDV